MVDLPSLRRAAQDGLPILPAQVLALCDEVGRARRWAAAWKAVAKYERLTSAAGWAGAVAGVETANMMLRQKVEALESALRPFAEQDFGIDALLTARRLLGLPDFPPIREALAELREVVGDLFDGDDCS